MSITWLRIISTLALFGSAAPTYAEEITHSVFGNVDQWLIREPAVNLPLLPHTTVEEGKYYYPVSITPGDTILVSAGGCVQTGGHGLTWKRYVDPKGPNSDRLYHGRILLPGLPDMRIDDFLNHYGGTWLVPGFPRSYVTAPHLSYEDDGYVDNGYYAHDNGTGDQCLNVGNAWISFTIIHAQ